MRALASTFKPTICAGILSLAVVSSPMPSWAVTVESVPNPRQKYGGWVTDMANVLSPATESEINRIIGDLEARNGVEIAVVTVPDTKPSATPKVFATTLFNRWGIGKKGENNGVLFLISQGERRVEIETGNGARAILPDSRVASIIQQQITPRFKQGDFDGGTLAGTTVLVTSLNGYNPPLNSIANQPWYAWLGLAAGVGGLAAGMWGIWAAFKAVKQAGKAFKRVKRIPQQPKKNLNRPKRIVRQQKANSQVQNTGETTVWLDQSYTTSYSSDSSSDSSWSSDSSSDSNSSSDSSWSSDSSSDSNSSSDSSSCSDSSSDSNSSSDSSSCSDSSSDSNSSSDSSSSSSSDFGGGSSDSSSCSSSDFGGGSSDGGGAGGSW